MISRFKQLLVLLGLFLAGLTVAQAQVLYGANGAGGNPATSLVTINPATGAATVVGPIGFSVTGLAVNPLTGVLYGSTGGVSPVSPNSIITINTTTGAGTLVGATGLGNPVADISFRSDGVLFGWSEATDDLVTINTATGVATVVGDSALATFGSGLAFNNTGTLFFAGSGNTGMFRTINPATGLPTNIASLTGSPGAAGNAISSLAVQPGTNVLFGVDLSNAGVGGAAFLVTINTATAVVTSVGPSIVGLDAIAFAPFAGGSISPVPTLSEWATLLLAVLMAVTAFVALRRRAPPAK